MAESISEGGSFTPDLFSPLQFCEVVEEGQQQHRQQLHLHRHHSQLGQQQVNGQVQQQSNPTNQHQSSHEQVHQQQTTHHSHQQTQVHTTTQQQNVVSSQQQLQQAHQQQPQQQAHSQQQQVQQGQQLQQNSQQQQQTHQNQELVPQQSNNSHEIAQHTSTVKQELPQTSHQIVSPQSGLKCINMNSSMEIFLATPVSNGLSTQSVNVPVVALPQQPITQQLYQMQINRQQQQMQQIQLNSLQIQSPQQIPIDQHLQNAISEATVVGISPVESFSLPLGSPQIVSSPVTSVATQATQTEQPTLFEEDEPEIIFYTTKSSPSIKNSGKNDATEGDKDKTTFTPKRDCEAKPIPIKKTWRRPWKKKKEREKRQPVKKSRRVKRKRIVVPKKSSVHIDPRNGPPIDTSRNVVQRQSEDQINQLKQKRQRIKLNRNSGREYINRLGKVVRARKIGSPCNCPLKCWDRMGTKVLDIFNNFWDLCDFNLQNSYLFTCLKLCDVKRRYTKKQPAEESRRQNTFEYFVRINGKHFRVCKKAFMSSHGLTSDKRLRTLFTQMKDGALIPEPDKRGKHLRPNKPSSTPGTHHNGSQNESSYSHLTNKIASKPKNRLGKKKSHNQRTDHSKQTMYTPPPPHVVTHIHPPPPPPPPAHGTTMQEPPHAYIPNGDIYFPGHYLEPPQAMATSHMNQIPSCQKMLESPAYFMAGMKENTFHQ